MSELRYDSYCGIYCGACEIMHAETEEDEARVLKLWEGTLNAGPGQMHCSGCKSDNLFFNCAQCVMRPCAINRGVEFCIECEEYPCGYYEAGKQAVDQVPYLQHMKAIIGNQRYIKDHGVERWLEDQKNKWQCPQCGTSFA